MRLSDDSGKMAYVDVMLYGIMFLFFFQLLADFVEAIYAFGLLGTSIPPEIVSVLFLFTPVLLLLWRPGLKGRTLFLVGVLVLASRLIEVTLDTRGRMLVAGLGVGSFMLWLPALLWNHGQYKSKAPGFSLGAGLTISLSLSIVFRALNSGTDITTYRGYQLVGWMLAIIAAVLLYGHVKEMPTTRSGVADDRTHDRPGQPLRVIGLSLGITSGLVLLYFAFSSPNVIARWTGLTYLGIVTLMLLALSLFALLLTTRYQRSVIRASTVWVANLLFVFSLVSLILVYHVRFPKIGTAYPLAEPAVTPLQYAWLTLTLLLVPIILIDFMLFSQELIRIESTSRSIGGAFSVSALFLLILILAQVFTTTYDYIPVIGPFFRDKFWFVFLLGGLGLLLPLFLIRWHVEDHGRRFDRRFPGVVFLISLVTILGILLTSTRPAALEATGQRKLRLLTYNIQQGYSEDGKKNFDGQLELMREIDADVIGLQESDTNRIAGGNSDVVRYFADKLNMHSYYGPKVVPGTFGVALLSKFPVEDPRTFFMYSEGEQTAAIHAQIHVGGETYNLFVTHLGNGGPIVQQEAVLAEVNGRENVVLMGDFNFRPGSEQYRLTTGHLEDAWLVKWADGVDDQGSSHSRRIDHIFLSSGMEVSDIRYYFTPQSDHPALMAEIEW